MQVKALKWYESLSTRKGRKETGCFLVEGFRSVEWILQHFRDDVQEIVAVEGTADIGFNHQRWLTEAQFKKISQVKTPQGIAAVVQMPEGIYSDRLPETTGDRILFLEHVQDPGNVGSCIRSAAAFGFSGVLMTDQCADPFSPKCVQSTAGSVLQLWYRRHANVEDMIQSLKKQGYVLIATDLGGIEKAQLSEIQDKIILALGNEGEGLSETIRREADLRWKLPMNTHLAESLNVAACGAIGMYLLSDPVKSCIN